MTKVEERLNLLEERITEIEKILEKMDYFISSLPPSYIHEGLD